MVFSPPFQAFLTQSHEEALEQLQKLSCGHTPATHLDEL